jgi:hypothetical protein
MPSNPLSRLTRGLGHDKGSKIKGVVSPPTRSEGKDGDMQIYNGHLYIKDKYTWHHFVPKSEFKINKLIDETGGTVHDTEVDYIGSNWNESDIATMCAKINKIIELLQLDIK